MISIPDLFQTVVRQGQGLIEFQKRLESAIAALNRQGAGLKKLEEKVASLEQQVVQGGGQQKTVAGWDFSTETDAESGE